MADSASSRVHPFDIESLDLGSFVTSAEIEAAYGVPRDSRQYPFSQMEARSYIEKAMRRRLGKDVTIISRGDDLVILTDHEAHEYLRNSQLRTTRRMKKDLLRVISTNPENLTSDEKNERLRRIASTSGLLALSRANRKELPTMKKISV